MNDSVRLSGRRKDWCQDVRMKAVLASGFQAEVRMMSGYQAEVRINIRFSGWSKDRCQVFRQKEGSISGFQAEVRIDVRLSGWRQDRRGVSDGHHFSVLLQNNTRQYTVSFLIRIGLKPKIPSIVLCHVNKNEAFFKFFIFFNQEHATFKCIAKETNTLLVTALMFDLIFARIKFKMSEN